MLEKLLHPYPYQLIHYLLSKDNGAVVKNGNNARIFLLLSADYGNIGDIAITLAQTEYLRQLFPDYEIIHLFASDCYKDLKSLKRNIGKNDILTIVGGGNSGDLYYPYEIFRQLVVTLFKKNPIINFPQSVKFVSASNEKKAKRVYNGHDNLLYLARDRESFEFIKNNYKVKTFSLPDIVMTLDLYSHGQRNGIVTCFRNDKEKKLKETDLKSIRQTLLKYSSDILVTDTYQKLDKLSFKDIEKLLESFVTTISTKKLLLTDRLHGMILGFVTGTPTIVFPNNNNKIMTCYEWIKNCKYVTYIKSLSDFPDTIARIITADNSRNEFNSCRDIILRKYDELSTYLKHEI